jgi:enoyl-[acyl-carrier protein] reductase III
MKGAALITGGTRGIGRAISIKLAKDGYNPIFVNYLQNDAAAEKTLNHVSLEKSECILLKANMAILDDIDGMFQKISEQKIKLGAFIHCAALNAFKPILEIKPNQWDLTLNINTRAFLYCAQKCVPLMPPGSSIVGISSLGSHHVLSNYGAMGPAKSALETIVRYLGVELSEKGIRVNAVNGGIIKTESINKFPNAAEWLEKLVKKTPAGRIGKPEDISNAVSFLCDQSSEFINGEILVVDGGLSL